MPDALWQATTARATRWGGALLGALSLCGCPNKGDDSGAKQPSAQEDVPAPIVATPSPGDDQAKSDEAAHHVVFADRTSQSYLLLLPGTPSEAPSREALAELVRERLSGAQDEPEVELLLDFIATEVAPSAAAAGLDPQQAETLRHRDLLGIHIALLPLAPQGGEALIPLAVLRDPISTRALSEAERQSLPERRYVLVLRGHYRNRFGVRGLRLLQTLVRLLAAEQGALIHDPDTAETMGVEAFTARRLRSSVGNIADQIVVVPFPDPRHGKDFVRLGTRGMRRFGSVDLDLDGLPRDARTLEAATQLLHGLAYRMVRDGEYDREGYAVEVDDVVDVGTEDIKQAYGGRSDRVMRCEDCRQQALVHLVEREAEAHDPAEHVVARVVAPRQRSDQPDYDHAAWVREALHDLLGTPTIAVQ